MTPRILAALPVKPFAAAKARLAPTLDDRRRGELGRNVARHTAVAATDAGALVAIVTADAGVAAWAHSHGYLVVAEADGPGPGLDRAATAAVAAAAAMRLRWAIVHADLPLATPAALRKVFDAARGNTVLVPSYNGGTNLIAGSEDGFRFAYGPGSFHRHLLACPGAVVVSDAHLALDLDTAADLARAARHPNGTWLRHYVI
jgi:2-phospho-L-lactate guanylyltransferase